MLDTQSIGYRLGIAKRILAQLSFTVAEEERLRPKAEAPKKDEKSKPAPEMPQSTTNGVEERFYVEHGYPVQVRVSENMTRESAQSLADEMIALYATDTIARIDRVTRTAIAALIEA